jgi:hypothetical protein
MGASLMVTAIHEITKGDGTAALCRLSLSPPWQGSRQRALDYISR